MIERDYRLNYMIKNRLDRIPAMSSPRGNDDQVVKFDEMEGSTSFTEVCLSQDASCAPNMATEIINRFLGLELPRTSFPLCDKALLPRLLSLQSLLLSLQHCVESSRSVESASWNNFFDLLYQFVEKSFASNTSLLPLRLFCLFTTLHYFIIDRVLFEPGIAFILVQLMDKMRSFARCTKGYQALCVEMPYCEMGVLRLLREEAQRQAQQQYTRQSRFPSQRMLSRPELWNDIVFSQQSVVASQSQVTLPIPSQISFIVDKIQQWNLFVQSAQYDLSAVMLQWLTLTFSPSLSTAANVQRPSSSHAIKLANAILRYTIIGHSPTWNYKDSLPGEHMMMILVLCQRAAGNGQSLALLIQRNLFLQSNDENSRYDDRQLRREVEFGLRMAVTFLSHTSFMLMNDHMIILLIHQLIQKVLVLDNAVAMSEDRRQIKWIRRLWRDILYLCLHRPSLLLHYSTIESGADMHSLIVDVCHHEIDESNNGDHSSRATAAYVMMTFLLFVPHCVTVEEHQILIDKAQAALASVPSDTSLIKCELAVLLLSVQERMNGVRANSNTLLLVEDWCTSSETLIEEHKLLNVKEMKTVDHILEALKPFQSSSNSSLTVDNINNNTNSHKVDYFSQLPLELLRVILSHLTYKRVIRLSTLNHHFRTAAKCEQLWQQLFRRSFPRIHVFADELAGYLRHDRSIAVQADCEGMKPMCLQCSKIKMLNKTKLQCCQQRRDQHQWRLLFQSAADSSADAWRKGWTQFRLCPLVGCSRAIKGGSNEEKRHLLAHQKEERKKHEKNVRLLAKILG